MSGEGVSHVKYPQGSPRGRGVERVEEMEDFHILLYTLLYCFKFIDGVISLCNFFLNFIYLFIFGCVGSSFLWEGFLQLWQAGATLHRGARASHYRGLSCCRAQAPDAQAQ